MNDQDNAKDKKNTPLIVLLAFCFLLGFFILFIGFPNHTNSPLFQFMFFLAALTVVFTGILHSTGLFKTTGQQLGGAAAVFIIMFLALTGGERMLVSSDHNRIKNRIRELAEMETTQLTVEQSLDLIESKLEELRTMQTQHDNLLLVVDRKTIDSDGNIRKPTISLDLPGSEGGTALIPLEDLKQKDVEITSSLAHPEGGRAERFTLSYQQEDPEVSVEWFPESLVESIRFTYKNHRNTHTPEIRIDKHIK